MELSVNTLLSLDGVMQGPGGPEEDLSGGFTRGGWLVPHADEDMGAIVDRWFAAGESLLFGRTTYVMMRDYWREITDPGDTVAAVLNNRPKFLVSTTAGRAGADWGDTTLIADDVLGRVRALKEGPGGEIQVHGSWRLARTLHAAGLVDVFRLLIFPTVVGDGKRLFDGATAPADFAVEDSATTRAGLVSLTLRPRPFTTGTIGIVDGRETTL
ncbi:dihydrofolate reductase family protein [Nocardiopsis sp. CT-R113]|uniref:Dihydrofolate reductase family protein n=1 Tax=Nocardiopsis codii TaxID=3065942 RepID=A0ABU7K360_9ACTN|nr:dihydrofolate reductase family protein [Nocardiopsis sp. CT-R113]MEE2036686.1 dihydrofolate reductase family protein [Nocardiopsis sp. CT-R113]